MERIDHIAIVVKDLNRVTTTYEAMAGRRVDLFENSAEMDVRIGFISMGDVVIELMQPIGSGPLNRHIETKGQGIHHIAYRVKNLERVLSRMGNQGVRILDEEPRNEGGALCVFLDPIDTGGVLTELVQR